MWLFTQCGFFSVVVKPEDEIHGTVTVRSRLQGDLDALRATYLPELGPSLAGAGIDYPFRATVARTDFAEGMKRMALDVNYGDFKSTVFSKQGANRARVYGKIWRDLIELEDDTTAEPPADTEPRMAWRLAKTIQLFKNRHGHWPTRIEMPKAHYNLLLLDIGQLWHRPMLAKLSFDTAESGVRALDRQGLSADYDPSLSESVDHREAFAWMFG